MRRYILYMAVALVAFAVGSFIFIKFSFKVVERSAIAQTSGLKTPADKEITLKSTTETLEKDDSDPEEKAAFEVLKPTIRKWLRGQKIKNEFTEASDESIKKISGKNKSELSEDEKRWFSLNSDLFFPEIFLIDSSDASVNSFLIF